MNARPPCPAHAAGAACVVALVLLALAPTARAAAADTASSAPPQARTAAAADTIAARTPAAAPRLHAWPAAVVRSDRLQHASLSFTLAAGTGLAGGTRAQAFGIILALGVAKELHDGRHGRFDVVDLAAGAAGAALGAFAAAKR
jgi:hypothetical protein